MTIKENTIVYPLPNSEWLEKREEYWELILPNDYKTFIMKNNGGVPNQIIFRCNNRGYAITRFLCILEDYQNNENGWYDIGVVVSQTGERFSANGDLTGVEVLPIVEISGGDYVCLDYRKNKENPIICVWSDYESDDFAPVTYWVADTFSEFVSMLEYEIKPDRELLRMERKNWRVLLPNDYKAFIMKNNGGLPNPNLLKFDDQVYTITRFLSSFENIQETEDGRYNITAIIESQIGERFSANGYLIGVGILPIAATDTGDYIGLDYRDTDNQENPTICLWSYDKSIKYIDKYDCIHYWIVDTFSEFLSMLE